MLHLSRSRSIIDSFSLSRMRNSEVLGIMNPSVRILHVGGHFFYLPLISRELRKRGFISDIASSWDASKQDYDFFIGSRFRIRDVKLLNLGRKYDIIHNHSPYFSSFGLSLLRKFGKRIIKHYHGSDLRVWKLYESEFCLVSTPDLLDYAPNGLWIPNPVDLEAFKPKKGLPNEVPTLLHYEYYTGHKYYDKNPQVKEIYDHAFKTLQQRGIKFALKTILGIPHDEMPTVINQSDIIICKVEEALGWYGNMAVEAMACGKPVVAYIRPDLYEKYKPPVYVTTPENLADKLQILIEDANLRKEFSMLGRRYVQEIHDVKKVADKLTQIYL